MFAESKFRNPSVFYDSELFQIKIKTELCEILLVWNMLNTGEQIRTSSTFDFFCWRFLNVFSFRFFWFAVHVPNKVCVGGVIGDLKSAAEQLG